jgi:acetylornithine deacetylase/succinyl-diaminopimelate desuccinylase-like protein
MIEVLRGVERLELGEDPLMGPAILALTEISSVPFPSNSVIPSICRATYDRRLLPGETKEDVLGPILDLARSGASAGTPGTVGAEPSAEPRAPAGTGSLDFSAAIGFGEYTAFTGNVLSQEKFFPAWLYPPGDWFVSRALKGLGEAGLTPDTRAYRFCTNAAHSAGIAGVPTVGFGPGREEDAHVVDERLPISELDAAARGYEGIIRAVLG